MIRLAFSIALIQWKQLIRDRRAFIMLIAFPVMLTSILSFALGGLFSGTTHQVSTVAVVNEDTGAEGAKLEDYLRQQTAFIRVVQVTDPRAAISEVNQGQVDGALVIPKSFTSETSQGKTVALPLEVTSAHSFTRSLVTQLVSSYGLVLADVSSTSSTSSTSSSASVKPSPAVKFNNSTSNLRPVTAGSYYAIGMMVMFLLSNAISRATSMVQERQGDRYKRLLAAPVGHVTLAIGQWLATFLIMLVQGAILLLCSRFILQIELGPVGQTALVLAGYAASVAGISTLLGSTIRSVQVVNVLASIGANIAAVLGGSIFPIYGFPQVMQRIAQVLPNGQALTRLVDSVMGVSTAELWIPVFYLLFVGIFLGALGGIRYGAPSRKGV